MSTNSNSSFKFLENWKLVSGVVVGACATCIAIVSWVFTQHISLTTARYEQKIERLENELKKPDNTACKYYKDKIQALELEKEALERGLHAIQSQNIEQPPSESDAILRPEKYKSSETWDN